MFRLSNNVALPATPAFAVKSFWLLLITVLVTACNAFGFQLLPSLCEVDLGCTADEVVAKGQNAQSMIQQLIPIATAIWLWFERRAPSFRLVLWRKPSDVSLQVLLAFAVFGLFTLGAQTAHAKGVCADPLKIDAVLRTDFGQVVIGQAMVDPNETPALIYVNPRTGSWSLVLLMGRNACIFGHGSDWQSVAVKPGEPT